MSIINTFLDMIEKGKQPKRGGRPVRHSAGMTIQEKHMNYMRGLSRVVGEACDKYFIRKGIPLNKSWKDQHKEKQNGKV